MPKMKTHTGAKKRFTPAPEADVDLLRTLLRSRGARVD